MADEFKIVASLNIEKSTGVIKEDVWFKNIPYFGFRPAANFVEDGIDDFNSTNTLGIKITKKFNGKTI